MQIDKKNEARALMGEYLRRKRLECNYLQEEFGVKVGYSPTSAKQAISQIERGSVSIPKNKLDLFVKHLVLDDKLFRQLDYWESMNQYEQIVAKMQAQLKSEYGIDSSAD